LSERPFLFRKLPSLPTTVTALILVSVIRGDYPLHLSRVTAPPEIAPPPVERPAEEAPLAGTDGVALAKSEMETPADEAAERQVRELFQSGRFAELASKIREQMQDGRLSASYKAWLEQQEGAVKLGWAWSHIRQRRCQEAIPLLDAVLKRGPEPLALKALGFCALNDKDWWLAHSYLERYFEQKTSDPEAYMLLAEAQEALGSYSEAQAVTEKALALDTLTDEERQLLEKRQRSLEAKAQEGTTQGMMQSGVFLIRYQLGEHETLLQAAIDTLQDTSRTLSIQLGLPAPETTLEVILHRSENFTRVTHGPQWAAGLYDGRIRLPIPPGQEADEDFARALRHELAHAMLSSLRPHENFPPWFQEGLAQVAECPGLCWSYRFAASQHPFLSPEAFVTSFLQLSRSEAQIAYKQSFYLLQVLHSKYGLPGIRQIIESLAQLSSLDSDRLLYQVGMNFADLHASAKAAWDQGRGF